MPRHNNKRPGRKSNELIWVQPQTVDWSPHACPRRPISPPEEVLPTRASGNRARGIGSLQRQHQRERQVTTADRLQVLSMTCDAASWKLNADLLDLGAAASAAGDTSSDSSNSICKNDLAEVHSFVDCSATTPVSAALITPQSMDGQPCLNVTFSGYEMMTLADEDAEDSDKSAAPGGAAHVTVGHNGGFSAIHLAAKHGNTVIIRLLLSACPEYVDLCNGDSQTPLHVAANEGHVDVTQELLQLGANALLQDAMGRTALHLAVATNCIESVRLLLDSTHGPGMICVADGVGKTSLHHAVVMGRNHIVQLLLEKGADPRTPII